MSLSQVRFFVTKSRSFLLTFLLFFASNSLAQIKFTDVTKLLAVPGNTIEGVSCYGHGAIMADINKDQKPDIYISNAVRYADRLPETLYISTSSGFQENDKARRVEDPYGWTGSHGIIFFDYDNDGDYDLYNATTDDRNRLYRNSGNGYFDDVTDQAKLPKISVVFPDFDTQPYGYGTRGVVAFDANNDGYMDLLAVNWGPAENRYNESQIIRIPPQPNEFYLNKGNGTFVADDSRGLTRPYNHSDMGTQGVTAVDVDNDGDIDVLICHRNYVGLDANGNVVAGPDFSRIVNNQLMINDGRGYFTDETDKRGLSDSMNDCNGATFADFDNDGDLDLFVVPKDKNRKYIKVYRNRGNGYFDEITDQLKLTQWGFSTAFFDMDNDGDLDIFAPRTREKSIIYQNEGDGRFTQLSSTGIEISAYDPRGVSIGDFDSDGDLDIYYADANKFVNAAYSNRLFRNDLNSTNRWLKITGRGPKGDMGAFGTKIWAFDTGYMEQMNHLVGYREIFNAYGYLCQDDPVQHFGLAQRDYVDVKIKLLDGTTLKIYGVPAKTLLSFSKPYQMAMAEGNNQTGAPGQKLTKPFTVKVTDRWNNPVPGAAVQFNIVEGNGQLVESQPVHADLQGVARCFYVVGSSPKQQLVTASCPDIANSTIQFSVTMQGGNSNNLVQISGNNQEGPVDQILPNDLVVKVVDSNGLPISNVLVRFKVISGAGKVEDQDSVTVSSNGEGLASVSWRLGKNCLENQVVRAFLVSDPNIATEFKAIAFGPASKLVWLSSLNYSGTVDKPLPDSLAAQVVDSNNHPISGFPIKFTIITGNGHVNGNDSVEIPTNSAGISKCQWILGTTSGTNSNQVSVTANSLSGSPVLVTASAAPGDPATLTKISGDQQSGPANTTLPDSLLVSVTDHFGNPIINHSVSFLVKNSDASFNGKSSVTVLTDQRGIAGQLLTLGQTGGVVKIEVSSQYNNKPLTQSPQTFSATIAGAASRLEWLSQLSYRGTVDQFLPDSLTAKVVDEFGNAVPNYPVKFSVTSGNGSANGESEITLPTRMDGTAKCGWKLGTLAGSNNNQLLVTAADLQNSPVTVVASAVADQPFQLLKLEGDKQSGKPGQTLPLPLKVAIQDSFGNAIVTWNVNFEIISGDASFNGKLFVRVATDEKGIAQQTVQLGKTAGWIEVRVSAYANNAPLKNSPSYFTASLVTSSFDITKTTVSAESPVVANGRNPMRVTVLVKNSNNLPVGNIPVSLNVTGQSNAVNPAQTVTDPQGFAKFTITSTKAEFKQITGVIGEEKLKTAPVSVTFTPGPIAALQKLSGDHQKVVLGREIESAMVVAAIDSFGNFIPDQIVAAFWQNPAGIQTPLEPRMTEADGTAAFHLKMGWQVGVYSLILKNSAVPEAIFQIEGILGVPSKIQITSGDGQSEVPGVKFSQPLTVIVLDSKLEPLALIPVTFKVLSGDVIFLSSATVATDTTGQAGIECKLNSIGTAQIQASVSGLAQTAVFSVSAHSTEITRLELVAGDRQTARFGETLPQPLQVRVLDELNRGVANVGVLFQVTDGGGHVQPEKTIMSDETGQAIALWTLGSSGTQSARAFVPGKPDLKATFVAFTRSNQKPIIFCPTDTTITAGTNLSFTVTSFDPDHDFVSLSAPNLPEGATFNSHLNLFMWQPLDQQVGEFNATFYADDGWGGLNSKTCRIKVNPLISAVPLQSEQPTDFILSQNYPNPFNPSTQISFVIPYATHVKMWISNEAGQMICNLADQTLASGKHQLMWDARDATGRIVPSGIYYCRMETTAFQQTIKLILLK